MLGGSSQVNQRGHTGLGNMVICMLETSSHMLNSLMAIPSGAMNTAFKDLIGGVALFATLFALLFIGCGVGL